MASDPPILALTNPYREGESVLRLQQLLERSGFPVYGKDGIFGPITEQALRRFQAATGIRVDGIAGPITWEMLEYEADRRGEARKALRRLAPAEEAPETLKPIRRRPSEPEIRIDARSRRLTLYEKGGDARSFPVAVGKPATPSPQGLWRIETKVMQPGGGLGTRWMGLNVPWGNYGIHGTNAEWSIGRAVSNGCIRMHNRDVEWLFDRVERGTSVQIQA